MSEIKLMLLFLWIIGWGVIGFYVGDPIAGKIIDKIESWKQKRKIN